MLMDFSVTRAHLTAILKSCTAYERALSDIPVQLALDDT